MTHIHHIKPLSRGGTNEFSNMFAMMLRADGVEDPAIYAYYPLEAEWVCVSATLAAHLQGWNV